MTQPPLPLPRRPAPGRRYAAALPRATQVGEELAMCSSCRLVNRELIESESIRAQVALLQQRHPRLLSGCAESKRGTHSSPPNRAGRSSWRP